MVDDVFRSYRNHDTAARDGSETSRGGIGDLRAELARLTGQGDPYRDGGRDDGFQARKDDSCPEQRQRGEDHCVLWRRQPSPVPREHGKQKKAPSNRPTFLPTVSDDRHAGEMRATEADETYGAYSFYDGLPSPRWRLVMVIVVLGLAWLGVASAFYHAVFGGGAVLPTLPPLMAADNGPKKIVPNDSRSNDSSQTSMVSADSSEKFVSRWPADNQEPPSSNPGTLRPAVPIALATSAPPPAVPPPALSAPSLPASHSSEPKKIHTIIIRSDGSEQTDNSAAAVAHNATSARAPGTR
jgi:hypothetical protein